MKKIIIKLFVLLWASSSMMAQVNQVRVESDTKGMRLMVDGKPFMVNGINWDYVPIGYNVLDAKFWEKPDDIIKAGLDEEMALWQNMGVNAIRTYIGMPPKWITYIYENFGIYTMINHQFGAYGLTIDGVWNPKTKYADPKVMKHLIDESVKMANMYKDTPGLLLFMLGNENNYHLTWEGAETDEGIVINDQDQAKRAEARAMYKLFNDAAQAIKAIDKNHPVGICNGDLLYLDIVAAECVDLDIYGTNMYRGVSFYDAFDKVRDVFGKPILFTEFGSDAFNARDNKEDQLMQSYYMVNNWKEIYQNAYGQGKTQNSLGGFTFQSSDGWFKAGFDERKDAEIHNTRASWPSNGYNRDQAKPGDKNMNEEWFGIAAKGPTDIRGLYTLYPRAAYYSLKEAHEFNPFNATSGSVEDHFKKINLMEGVLKARGDKAALGEGGSGPKLSISNFQAKFTTFNTGGSLVTTPDNANPDDNVFPNQQGFDHMQSYFVGIEGKASNNMKAMVNFNILGNVAQNPINEIFYENVGRPVTVTDTNGNETVMTDVNRVRVYQAEFEWNTKNADIKGFYRTGHYHWGYEGDFFGLYPEANYGPNLDLYNGEIMGVEVHGKEALDGFTAAIGPQLWWGANPAMLVKYSTNVAKWKMTGIYHKDFDNASFLFFGGGATIPVDENGRRFLDPNQIRSGVLPPWITERATLVAEKKFGKFEFKLGGIWGGRPLNGITYQDIDDNGNVVEDKIKSSDNWGWKAKLMYEGGKFNWYAQGGVAGLVANGGVDQTLTFTGWKLKDIGSGNMSNFLSGFVVNAGSFQIAPNFLWQKPLVDPMPNSGAAPGRLRNFIDDPFAVRWNRETTAAEILLTFDPTPATYMYQWDNDRAEDAKFAMNLGFVFRHQPTTTDAHIGFDANRNFFAFPNSVPAQDLWEIHSRMVSKLNPDVGIIGNFYYGTGQGNGGGADGSKNNRTITRFGADLKMIYKKIRVASHVKVNDWGPFDYHRDFNQTFPLQLGLNISTSLGKPDWFILPNTEIGVMGMWRSLDQFSGNRFAPLAAEPNAAPILSTAGFPNGSEWEIRTYIHINIGK